MRMRLLVLVIATAMMLATIQSAAAAPVGAFTAKGTVQYESGETCPYGWNLEMENLDQELEGELVDALKIIKPQHQELGCIFCSAACAQSLQISSHCIENQQLPLAAAGNTRDELKGIVYPQELAEYGQEVFQL